MRLKIWIRARGEGILCIHPRVLLEICDPIAEVEVDTLARERMTQAVFS